MAKFLSPLLKLLLIVLLYFTYEHFQTRHLLDNSHTEVIKEIEVLSLDGQPLTINLTSESKPHLIYFFAPWCGVCLHSVPNLDQLYKEEKETVNISLIALDYDSIEAVKKFKAKTNIALPVYLGEQKLKEKFTIQVYPTYYLMNSDASITHSAIGYTSLTGLKLRLWMKK